MLKHEHLHGGEIQNTMVETACAYAAETKAVCVLKDACTVVADPQGNIYLNLSGNAGMATAGSGDVLSGILASVVCMFLAGKETAPDNGKKAALGVFLHGLCGDAAAEKQGLRGMTARDIIHFLPDILHGKEENI